jgi:choline-sulfatase
MNVLFIVSDDLRVGGAFGSREVRTPNIDRLAARGVSFDEAYCQFPLCAPSRASFLSGLRPNTVRVYDLQTHVRGNIPDLVTLPQYFRQHGYFAGRVGKLYHQGVPGDIGRPVSEDLHDDPASWDVAFNPSGADKEAQREGRITNLMPKLGFGIGFAYLADESGKPQTDELVASKTIELIKAHKDRPFFIAAGFYRPHVPEVAPKSFFDLYPNVAFTPESPANKAAVLPAARGPAYSYTGLPAQSFTPEQLRAFVQGYYASATFMDSQVGRLLDALEKSGVADRTIVVFTSDHGFSLGEHGLWQKTSLWTDVTKVPLVIYAPRAKANGTRSRRIVELLDLYPTLADLAGLPAPPKVEGRSLRPLLANANLARWNYPARSQVSGGQSVRFENWRYSEWGKNGEKGIELYDVKRDPREYRNLAAQPQYAKLMARLKLMLPGDPPPSTAPKLPPERGD